MLQKYEKYTNLSKNLKKVLHSQQKCSINIGELRKISIKGRDKNVKRKD